MRLFALLLFIFIAPLFGTEPTEANLIKAKGQHRLTIRDASIRSESLDLLQKGITANLRIVNSGGQDLDNIARDLYTRHRIIGVGEATHGTSEIFAMRTELLKSLAKLGLRSLVIELNMAGAQYLDDYVCGRVKGNPSILEVLQNGRLYTVWQTPEVADMFGWIRDFNTKHLDDPIRIYGIDGQAASANRLLSLLEAKLSSFDSKGARARDKAFGSEISNFEYSLMAPDVKVPGPELDKLLAERQQFVAELRVAVASLKLDERERKVAELELRGLEQDCSLEREVFLAAAKIVHTSAEIMAMTGSDTMRDKYMAENLRFLDKNLVEGEARIMVWAHSGHLSRRPLIEMDINCTHLPLGNYLASWYGDKYHVLNITVGSGTVRAFDTFNIGPESTRKALPVKIEKQTIEGIISRIGVKGTVFFETSRLPMRDLTIDFLAIGGVLEPKAHAGLARGTVSDFDSFLYIPSGNAATPLKP
jgi:erythromycin esterase